METRTDGDTDRQRSGPPLSASSVRVIENRLAATLLVYALKAHIFGNFFLRFNILRKPGAFPRVTRVFNDEGVALVPALCPVKSSLGRKRSLIRSGLTGFSRFPAEVIFFPASEELCLL